MSSASSRNRTRELKAAVDDCVEQFGVPEPGVFLAHIMSGVDPRQHSPLLALLRRLSSQYPASLPPLDAWQHVCTLVDLLPPFSMVDVGMSVDAARLLMPYLYAKKKDVTISGSISHSDLPPVELDAAALREVIAELTKDIAK